MTIYPNSPVIIECTSAYYYRGDNMQLFKRKLPKVKGDDLERFQKRANANYKGFRQRVRKLKEQYDKLANE